MRTHALPARRPGPERALPLVIEARRRLAAGSRPSGRAWINGREVGGPDRRYAHLGRVYD
jgi:hypothetical protein